VIAFIKSKGDIAGALYGSITISTLGSPNITLTF
jgi:hypothetical protein